MNLKSELSLIIETGVLMFENWTRPANSTGWTKNLLVLQLVWSHLFFCTF